MLLLNQIICDFYPLATKSKKKITLKSKHKHLYVLGNSKELFRAFNNLLKNAINYSSENSNIEITTSLTNKHINIKISNSCNKNLSTKELNKIIVYQFIKNMKFMYQSIKVYLECFNIFYDDLSVNTPFMTKKLLELLNALIVSNYNDLVSLMATLFSENWKK